MDYKAILFFKGGGKTSQWHSFMSLVEILEAFYCDEADGNSLAHMPCPQSPLGDVDQCVSQRWR